jgi:glucan exporter ATP-binding protein
MMRPFYGLMTFRRQARLASTAPLADKDGPFAVSFVHRMPFFRLYARAFALLSAAKGAAIALALANILVAAAQFAEPVLLGRIVDILTAARAAARPPLWDEIALPLAAWVGFGLFAIFASVVVALNADRLAHRRRLAVTAAYFEHALHLPLSFHVRAHSGRLLKVMIEGADALFTLWLSFFREHFAGVTSLFVLLPLTVLINWRLGALLVALVIVFGVIMNFVLRRTERRQGEVGRFSSDLAERVSDALGNVPVIQSFARVEEETRAVRGLIDALLAAQLPVLSWWAAAAIATRACATLTLFGIFVVGIWLNIHGLATIGEIIAFMNLATMLITRLEQIVGLINYMFLQAPRLAQFFDVLDAVSTVVDRPNAIAVGRLEGGVAFENVSYSYDGLRDALSGLAFHVAAGRTVALVGATGSGKSTTLSLLHRVFDPTRGRVLIDGRDIREMTLLSLRRNIGVVFQEPLLFARSIEDNLRVGKPDATAEEIARALERAQAADFVARLPNGLSTTISERGRTLSGGERQRLAIARALLKDPPILILDEATSALDAKTERQFQEALKAATAGRTTFVIAHRLATIRHADEILVFDHGRIVERGAFDELVAAGGLFASLARAQFIESETSEAAR